MKGVKGRFHVTSGRLVTVGSKKRVCGDEIRASGVGKPTDTPNQTLISHFCCFRAEELLASVDSAIESMGTPEQ